MKTPSDYILPSKTGMILVHDSPESIMNPVVLPLEYKADKESIPNEMQLVFNSSKNKLAISM